AGKGICRLINGSRRSPGRHRQDGRLGILMPDFDQTSFLSGTNAPFIADLYARYLDDPNAVDESWRRFFADLADDPAAVRAETAGPAWAPPIRRANGANGQAAPAASAEAVRQAALDSIRALNLIRAYRV